VSTDEATAAVPQAMRTSNNIWPSIDDNANGGTGRNSDMNPLAYWQDQNQ